jgi:hypothetical protein
MPQKYALGNQSNRRKTKYDTSPADELKKEIFLSMKPKTKPGMPPAFKKKNLESKSQEQPALGWDDDGVPYVNFNYINDLIVFAETKEDFDTLMQFAEVWGLRWSDPNKILPTSNSFFYHKGEYTPQCINLGSNSDKKFELSFRTKDGYALIGKKPRTMNEFYSIVNLDEYNKKMLNEFFEFHKPNRASKGEQK